MRHSRRPPRCADRFRDLTVAACAVALGSCASASPAEPAHPFEVYYREGDWTAALSTFEADSTLWADDWAVYRTALIYARPDRETFDPDESARLLDGLIGREPPSLYAPAAATVRNLLRETERVPPASDEDAMLHRADGLLYRIGLAYADPDGDLFDPQGATRILGELIEGHPDSRYAAPARILVDLLVELRRSYRAEAALRQQLDQLKQVDLGGAVVPPPPPPPPPPPAARPSPIGSHPPPAT